MKFQCLLGCGMLMVAVQCHKWVMAIFGRRSTLDIKNMFCGMWTLPRINMYAIYLIDSFLSRLCHCQVTSGCPLWCTYELPICRGRYHFLTNNVFKKVSKIKQKMYTYIEDTSPPPFLKLQGGLLRCTVQPSVVRAPEWGTIIGTYRLPKIVPPVSTSHSESSLRCWAKLFLILRRNDYYRNKSTFHMAVISWA